MTATRLARLGVILLILIVLSGSGIYVLVYLARWEWNRAIVSGIFFVAALVVLSTVIVLRRIRRVEAKIDSIERTRSTVSEENARRVSRHFDWLRQPPDHLGVFVPVLFGAGVILSLTAYVLERLAGVIAGPTLDMRTARLVAPDLPLGDGTRPPSGAVESGGAWRRAAGAVAMVLTAAVVIGVAVAAIGDATQTRPEVPAFAGSTRIEMQVLSRADTRSSTRVAESLWAACRVGLPADVELVELVATGPDRVALVLDHQLGRYQESRFIGCLQDLTLTEVRGEIHSVVMAPPESR